MDSVVRLSGILIQDFKNVREGYLDFSNRRKGYRTSILGLYGQNGSGKTALIDALQLLKYLLCGKPVPQGMADFVHVDAEYATIKYIFDISLPTGRYEAFYEARLKKIDGTDGQNTGLDEAGEGFQPAVVGEVLSYSFEGEEGKIRKSPLIDTRTEKVFLPTSKYESLLGKDSKQEMELLVAKKMAAGTSRSFLFSRELLNAVRRQRKIREEDTELVRHLTLLERLVLYGNYELFVINTSNTGMISMNVLPLSFKYTGGNSGAVGQLALSLESPAVVPVQAVEIVEKIIRNMNIVLEQIVPGLTISVKEMGAQIMGNGEAGRQIQLMSRKNSREIPLKYESEGIKKIISILQLFIAIYNQPSITVAIDELDAGIFEYLLGEMLRVLSEKGKGQLVFTSHNLRPLETIDRGFIAFTTTNPSKRYIRMVNVKDNNNLRDFYFRDIVLGEQDEEIYEPTNNAEIAMAFREAGEIDVP